MDSRSTAVGVNSSGRGTIDSIEPAGKAPSSIQLRWRTARRLSEHSASSTLQYPVATRSRRLLGRVEFARESSRRLQFRPVMRAPPAFSGKAQ
ncbi:hypothetical protein PC128_g23266 [Phytophthora cactorum]|nr:hypothetical protein PC128_g23266 [Phytophthora cactorum]